jgi:hypothetical protein
MTRLILKSNLFFEQKNSPYLSRYQCYSNKETGTETKKQKNGFLVIMPQP